MAGPVLTDDQWARVEPVDGWFSRGEADFLYGLCDGPWCEIGCWKGRSTLVMAQTGFVGWAIDHFTGSPEHEEGTDTFGEFKRNLAGFPNVVTFRRRFEDAWQLPGTYKLLHLDADHSYEKTKEAFRYYAPKVRDGGHVVFHDGRGDGWPGVEKFLRELRRGGRWEEAGTVERLVAFRRK